MQETRGRLGWMLAVTFWRQQLRLSAACGERTSRLPACFSHCCISCTLFQQSLTSNNKVLVRYILRLLEREQRLDGR